MTDRDDGQGAPVRSRAQPRRPRLRIPRLPIPRPPIPRAVRAITDDFRTRLVLAFGLVVAIALGLVLATLPRLLDDYFAAEERQNLETRTSAVVSVVARQMTFRQYAEGAPRPILLATQPMQASPVVQEALGTPAEGFVRELTTSFARADVSVTISTDPRRPEEIAYRLEVPFAGKRAPGEQREPISAVARIRVPDQFWSQSGSAAPDRLVTVRLSDPVTSRAQTLETIVGVMFAAAGLAMISGIVAAILLASRLTDPIRRLTRVTRALEEGRLETRVATSGSGSAEVAELSRSFNSMADRLQESIEVTRRDRDRGREFVADVSHELRTPIAALRTFNELLREGAAEDPGARIEFLEQSRQQIERLDWLAANLLELSKLDSGFVALDLRPDDLRAVVEAAVQQAEPVAQRKGVELALKLPGEPLRVPHDPQRVGQVIGNLLSNALKFTPRGGHIAVALSDGKDQAQLEVRDDGTGIEPSELPHVFERFFRGSRDPEARAHGSGLGLAIVRSIVDMHRGEVTIESAPGVGTDVRVTLPHA